jgi:hypothetical protein
MNFWYRSFPIQEKTQRSCERQLQQHVYAFAGCQIKLTPYNFFFFFVFFALCLIQSKRGALQTIQICYFKGYLSRFSLLIVYYYFFYLHNSIKMFRSILTMFRSTFFFGKDIRFTVDLKIHTMKDPKSVLLVKTREFETSHTIFMTSHCTN